MIGSVLEMSRTAFGKMVEQGRANELRQAILVWVKYTCMVRTLIRCHHVCPAPLNQETELQLGWQRLAVGSLPTRVRTLVLTGIYSQKSVASLA